MARVDCPNCGSAISDDATACAGCGRSLGDLKRDAPADDGPPKWPFVVLGVCAWFAVNAARSRAPIDALEADHAAAALVGRLAGSIVGGTLAGLVVWWLFRRGGWSRRLSLLLAMAGAAACAFASFVPRHDEATAHLEGGQSSALAPSADRLPTALAAEDWSRCEAALRPAVDRDCFARLESASASIVACASPTGAITSTRSASSSPLATVGECAARR
jgi:hypothetical protein